MKNEQAAVLVDSSIRRAMRQTIHRSLPQISVIAYHEIPTDLLIDPLSVIRDQEIFELPGDGLAAADSAANEPGTETPLASTMEGNIA